MALSIRNPETEKLAAEAARLGGQSKTQAVTTALKHYLARLRRRASGRRLADDLDAIAQHCSSLPVRDRRSADEILGYDEHGIPR